MQLYTALKAAGDTAEICFYFFTNGDLASHSQLMVLYYKFLSTVQKGIGGTKMASIHSILGQRKNNCTSVSIKYPERLLLIILTFLFNKTSSKNKAIFLTMCKEDILLLFTCSE